MEGVGLIAGANSIELTRGHPCLLGKSNGAQDINVIAERAIKRFPRNDGHLCCLPEKDGEVWSSITSPCQ